MPVRGLAETVGGRLGLVQLRVKITGFFVAAKFLVQRDGFGPQPPCPGSAPPRVGCPAACGRARPLRANGDRSPEPRRPDRAFPGECRRYRPPDESGPGAVRDRPTQGTCSAAADSTRTANTRHRRARRRPGDGDRSPRSDAEFGRRRRQTAVLALLKRTAYCRPLSGSLSSMSSSRRSARLRSLARVSSKRASCRCAH